MADVNNLVTSGLPPRSPGSLMLNGKRSDSNNTATTIFPSWLSSVQCPSSHSTSASNSFALIKRPGTLNTDDKVTDPTLENDKNKKIENSLPQPSKTPSSESIVAVKTEPSLDTDAKRNNMDQKMKRILANRQSAHRSRMKKLQRK
ncbi:PREDICTED: basic leucine zipper 34-like [Nelumbo nucifera]|uniref:Basic leucine zipper 34-like n=1 Tax=Nelumbo nucifera TaxID=4432 RepID=A0A1U8AGD5_NELNU|nr:PREDICTED: basic leucine zipper 34-like [Nelumbo nucifera]